VKLSQRLSNVKLSERLSNAPKELSAVG